MNVEQLALLCAAGIAFNGALYLLGYATRQILRQRRQARDRKLWREAWQPGDHDYCELSDDQEHQWAGIVQDLRKEAQP